MVCTVGGGADDNAVDVHSLTAAICQRTSVERRASRERERKRELLAEGTSSWRRSPLFRVHPCHRDAFDDARCDSPSSWLRTSRRACGSTEPPVEITPILDPALSDDRARTLLDRLVDLLILATRLGFDLRTIDRA